MARDDWRIRIDLPDEQVARGLLGRLRLAKSDARELADELRGRRLAATRDGDTVFVYAESGLQAEQARALVEQELEEERLSPVRVVLERWLGQEERWEAAKRPVRAGGPGDREVPPTDDETWEEDLLARGYAPWEVRIASASVREARDLAEQLEREGYSVTRTFRYVIAGTETREEAQELARRVHGDVEPGGELVYEVLPRNPFAVFGGLTGTGTGTPI
jgi:hypothetical protein